MGCLEERKRKFEVDVLGVGVNTRAGERHMWSWTDLCGRQPPEKISGQLGNDCYMRGIRKTPTTASERVDRRARIMARTGWKDSKSGEEKKKKNGENGHSNSRWERGRDALFTRVSHAKTRAFSRAKEDNNTSYAPKTSSVDSNWNCGNTLTIRILFGSNDDGPFGHGNCVNTNMVHNSFVTYKVNFCP